MHTPNFAQLSYHSWGESLAAMGNRGISPSGGVAETAYKKQKITYKKQKKTYKKQEMAYRKIEQYDKDVTTLGEPARERDK